MTEKKCEVHGIMLIPMDVSVSYGLPYFDKELIEARKKLFPNSKRNVLGGCTVGALGRSAEVLVCEDCRKAESNWNEVNRPNGNQKIGDIKI